jgi:hypothetical protein
MNPKTATSGNQDLSDQSATPGEVVTQGREDTSRRGPSGVVTSMSQDSTRRASEQRPPRALGNELPAPAGTTSTTRQAAMNSASVFQFPDQPTPEHVASASPLAPEVSLLPIGGKPNRKNITVELFSGAVPLGGFDSGVRRWLRKFMVQLTDAQILDGHRWPDIQCRRIFASTLTGDAVDWYSELRSVHPELTLELAGSLLVQQFKTKLPEQELMARIMVEAKQPQETYQAFAQRLLVMADPLPGGVSVEANARQAVHMFMKHAYYIVPFRALYSAL